MSEDWGWQCEDCEFFTPDDHEAERHSDANRHSLGRCPYERRRDRVTPDLTPLTEAAKAFVVEHRLQGLTVITDTHVISITEPSPLASKSELEITVTEIG